MVKGKGRFRLPHHEKSYCVTVQSGRRLVMEGVDEIVFCDEERVELKGKCHLRIQGEGLRLVELGNDNLEVNGSLKALFFEGWKP